MSIRQLCRSSLTALVAALVVGGCAAYPGGPGATARTFTLDVSPKVSAAYHALSALRDYDASDVDEFVVTIAEKNDAKAPTATQTLKRAAPGVTEPDLASVLHFAGLRYDTDYTVRVQAFKGTGDARLAIGDTTTPVRFEAKDGVLDDSRAIAPTVSLSTPVSSRPLVTIALSTSLQAQTALPPTGTGLKTAYDPTTHRYAAVWRNGSTIYLCTLDDAGRPIAGSTRSVFAVANYPAIGSPSIVYRGGPDSFVICWPLRDVSGNRKLLGLMGLSKGAGTDGTIYLTQSTAAGIYGDAADIQLAADVSTNIIGLSFTDVAAAVPQGWLYFYGPLATGTRVALVKYWTFTVSSARATLAAATLGVGDEPRRFAFSDWNTETQRLEVVYFDTPTHALGYGDLPVTAARSVVGAYDSVGKQFTFAYDRPDGGIDAIAVGAGNKPAPGAPVTLVAPGEGAPSNLRMAMNPAAQELALAWDVATPSGGAVRALRTHRSLTGGVTRFEPAAGPATLADLSYNPDLVQYLLSWIAPNFSFTVNPIDCFVR